MPFAAQSSFSKSQINRAADTLRVWWLDPDATATERIVEAFEVVEAFRASFSYPLRKTTVGLRQFVQRESTRIDVAQRLKRMPTILDKLTRQPKMELARMQDVAGCRAVLPGGAREVQGVLHRIEKRWEVKRLDDYVANPKPTGYRAIHVVVLRDGRLVEIQLRTPRQHEWAATVEVWSGRLQRRFGFNLKDGDGPAELLRYFELASLALHLEETGHPVDQTLDEEFALLRKQVRSYFVQN
ncbi:MAG: RelA/SpoT domain-containing protein [Thermoleophilia bacterium]|nr:RelA/SpoT domain-containing protein [Thermoleophilia bacterium]